MSNVKSRRALMRNSALVGTLCFSLMGGRAFAQDATYTFDIPSEPLAQALHNLARVSGQQIIFTPDQVAGKTAPALRGSFTADQALSRLFAGTDLIVDHSSTAGLMVQSKNVRAASIEAADDKLASIETVTVTGSHLQGVATASPIITVTRDDISASGYSTTGDLVRSLTVASGGGVNPASLGTLGFNGNVNVSTASSVDLRGLGSESTLTLINGHRLASDGYVGSVVDISAIPLAAIDHIEILTDGASAIYGSDAVAGVANFVLRKDFDGAQTSGRIGTSSDGGATEYEASQLLGTKWDGGGSFINYEYYHQNALYSEERGFSAPTPGPFSLVPEQDRHSVFGTVHQDIGNNLSIYAEGFTSLRDSQLTEALSGSTYKIPEDAREFGGTIGIDWRISPDWTASLTDTNSNSMDFDTEFKTGSSTPLVLKKYHNGLANLEGVVSGNLYELPSGMVSIALGGGYRHEGYNDTTGVSGNRMVAYAFGELHIPLVSQSPERIGLEKLELTVAGRYEHYSDFGTASDPKVGLLYAPTDDLVLRSTWSTAFRAPGLDIEKGTQDLVLDPGSSFGGAPATSQVLIVEGANPNLKPETSTTWTAGADYFPAWAPGLKVGLTAYGIGYDDRITTPDSSLATSFTNPANAPFITYNPSAALQTQLGQSPVVFQSFVKGAYVPSSVYAVIYHQYQNVTSENASGVDLTASYRWDTDFGQLGITANASWLRLAERGTSISATQILSGTVFNPTPFKGRAGVTWRDGMWSSALFVNNISGESDVATSPFVHVSSWTTVDAQVGVDLSSWEGSFSGFNMSLAVRNLFDQDPPYVPTNAYSQSSVAPEYDPANASPLGRFISITLTKNW